MNLKQIIKTKRNALNRLADKYIYYRSSINIKDATFGDFYNLAVYPLVCGLTALTIKTAAPTIAHAKSPSPDGSTAVKIHTAGSMGTRPEAVDFGVSTTGHSTAFNAFFNRKIEIKGLGGTEFGVAPFNLYKDIPGGLWVSSINLGIQIPIHGKLGFGFASKHTSINDDGSWAYDASMWWRSKLGINIGVQRTNLQDSNASENTFSMEVPAFGRVVLSTIYKTESKIFGIGADGRIWIFPVWAAGFTGNKDGSKNPQFDTGCIIPTGDIKIKCKVKDISNENQEASITLETSWPF